MARSLINKLGKWYVNWRGWHTDRKLLIIESDDWGTIRMPSRAAYNALAKQNPLVEQDAFARLDTLASANDLSRLFEVLTAFKDKNGNHPVITANTIVANPDFARIKASGFEEYFYEPFYETIARQPDGHKTLSLWKEGRDIGVYYPQLHGREHVHALAWLAELRAENKLLIAAFDYGAWGVPYQALTGQRRKNLQASLDIYGFLDEEKFQVDWLSESANIFMRYFGYSSTTFIPPAYTWHNRILSLLPQIGIKAIQGISLQYQPRHLRNSKYKRIVHYTGQSTAQEILYLVRNVFFEPSVQQQKGSVEKTLLGIQRAFDNRQPAIMGSHRLNFIGGLCEANRSQNLAMLTEVLLSVTKKWPEIEFITSDQLVEIIKAN